MSTSDWIAAIACVISFFALLTQFKQASQSPGKKSKKSKAPLPDPTLVETEVREEMPPMRRALNLTLMGIIIGLIELVVFSGILKLNEVPFVIENLPDNWKLAYYSLWLLPGLCFFFAFATVTTLFGD